MTALEGQVAEVFDTERAAVTVSGSAALLAAACCLARPGTAALVPGWICSGVVYALIHAGLRPLLLDVDDTFAMALDHADAAASQHEVGLVVFALFGGLPHGLDAWSAWARRHGVPFVADVAQSPDPSVWRAAARAGTAVITSFRPGKPLGAEGGGAVAGDATLIRDIQRYLGGGRDEEGRKVAFGLELALHPAPRAAASRVLAAHEGRVEAWRDLSRSVLAAASALLPGWRDCAVALSRVPRTDGIGRALHPDATFRIPTRYAVVEARLGPGAEPARPRLEDLYNRLTVTRVEPEERP